MELRVGFWRSYPPWKAEFFVYIQGTAERGLVDAREDEILEEEARLAAPDIVKRPLLAQVPLSTLKEDEKSCTICSETLGETVHDISENPVKLDCGHMFGDVCMLRWIGDHNKATCPMCRREYLKTAWEFPESLVGEDLWWMRALRQEEMGLREGLHEALPQIP
ncbi:hypothetical protein B0J14DRAFT_472497 [Halenospora varia]|nr:hypothetical protein B0J14DRAFT_472497 [Halenospora varia]